MPRIGFMEIMLILAIILLLFGPSKLPSAARAIGDAIREFRRATAGLPPEPKRPSEEELLIETAKKLGIETEGKTTEQIAKEILDKAKEVRREA